MATWTRTLSEWVRDGFVKGSLVKSLWEVYRVKTAVIPRKGMLVRKDERQAYYDYHYSHYNRDSKDSEEERYFCILDAITDEYGKCKFKYLSPESIKWTDWMTIKEFNENWVIQNPWV